MSRENRREPSSEVPSARKRTYAPPRLETFGTIRELTGGPSNRDYNFDGGNPPGHNKSMV